MMPQKKKRTTPDVPAGTSDEVAARNLFAQSLLRWYDQNKRDLPWRGEKDPYRIWISEIILQQTQVSQGWQYYRRFVGTWPDVASLAAATEDEVLKLWEGLGYYSRARHLHQAARQIMTSGGHFPTTLKGVLALKGVGPYTAAAICSMAYGTPVAAVDGNACRVFTRCFGIADPIDRSTGMDAVRRLATSLISHQRAGDFNQAIMDLGATVCTPRAPLCNACPLHTMCVALSEKHPQAYPVKTGHVRHSERHLVYVMVWQGDALLIRRRERCDIWRGLYEPLLIKDETLPESEPAADHASEVPANDTLLCLMRNATQGLKVITQGWKHVLTHRTLHIDLYELHLRPDAALPPALTEEGYRWTEREELKHRAFPAVFQKIAAGL